MPGQGFGHTDTHKKGKNPWKIILGSEKNTKLGKKRLWDFALP